MRTVNSRSFTLEYEVTNLGSAGTLTTGFDVAFYYCPGQSATGCISIGQQAIADTFGAGQSRTYTSPSLTLPALAESGTRYIRIEVDSTASVTETNESNNDRFDPIDITTLPDACPEKPITMMPRMNATESPLKIRFRNDMKSSSTFCPERQLSQLLSTIGSLCPPTDGQIIFPGAPGNGVDRHLNILNTQPLVTSDWTENRQTRKWMLTHNPSE